MDSHVCLISKQLAGRCLSLNPVLMALRNLMNIYNDVDICVQYYFISVVAFI